MFEPMKELLKILGYTILEENRGRRRGPDIVAEKGSRKLLIEMKGDSAALSVDFGTGIFQLIRYMRRARADLEKSKIILDFIVSRFGPEALDGFEEYYTRQLTLKKAKAIEDETRSS